MDCHAKWTNNRCEIATILAKIAITFGFYEMRVEMISESHDQKPSKQCGKIGRMRILGLMAFGLAMLATDFSYADQIMCPTQKQPNCSEIHPVTPMSCNSGFCNVVSRLENGKTVCMWSCSARFEDLFVNGVPMNEILKNVKPENKE